MQKLLPIITILLLAACTTDSQTDPEVPKPRLLITTDIGGDPDDTQSMIRLFVYTNEFELEGLVASASGTIGEVGKSVVRPELIDTLVNAYGEVYPNLVKHDSSYPTAEYLKSIIKSGNPLRQQEHVGDGFDTEGSDWIIQKVDESDEVLNISIWGGQTDVAQALWNVKNSRSANEYLAFIGKVRIYDIADQDSLFDYIHQQHPKLFYILNRAPLTVDKRNAVFRGMYLDGNMEITSLEWLNEHVIEGHGPLGALYPKKTWTAPNPHGAMKEGDTPSWFYFLRNGLNVSDQPDYGGWGGRFKLLDGNYYNDAQDTYGDITNARVTVARWRQDFQRDFAARMDRCVLSPDEVNQVPRVIVNDHESALPLRIAARGGEEIILDASGSSDPDGGELTFEWMTYPEPGNIEQGILDNKNGSILVFNMPPLKKGQEIHKILRVTDNGNPQLTAYQRIILSRL